jgi:hypothetical protein
MAFGALSAIQAGVSALPLFFGENNIFSGKARRATKELERTYKAGQAMSDVPAEMQRVLQQRQMRQNQGLSSTALGLYNKETQRGMSTAFGQLQNKRSALAGVGDIVRAGQDSALRLAGMEDQARQANMAAAEQTAINVGQMRQASQLRKLDESKQYWGTRKAESAGAISSALTGVGSAIGTSLYADAEAGEAQKGLGLSKMFKGRGTSKVSGAGIGAANAMANIMKSGRRVF